MNRYQTLILLAAFTTAPFQLFSQNMTEPDSTEKVSAPGIYPTPLQFRNAGPTRGGRVTAVRGVDHNRATFYMGTTGGGLWKTEDYGVHWRNLSDAYYSSPSIGAIAVYQENPDILYVGTGSDAIRSNVIVGKGIYKSLDAGESWRHVGLKNAGQIGAMEIHPENPDVVFAAVIGQPFRKSEERGVYRSSNGGRDWELVLFLSDSVGAVDLEFAPGNPEIVYAAMWRGERKPWTIISGGAEDGIFKSEDGGTNWERKTAGLPTGPTGKIDFAVSPDNPARVWAQVQASGGTEGLYRSDDYAETWVKVDLPGEIHQGIMHRPFYFTNLHVNPRNADHLWSGAVGFWTTRDGGAHWERVSTTHGDHHDLWIHPQDTLLMIEGNDGGAAVSRDGGVNWSSINNQPTAELYTCDVDDRYPYYLYSGQQDNTTICLPGLKPREELFTVENRSGQSDMKFWEDVGGCETGPVIPKPGDPHIVYANCKGRFSVYNRAAQTEHLYYIGAENLYGSHPDDVTYRFQRVTPMEVSPHDPDVVYYGSQYLHKTDNGGINWNVISPDLTANKKSFRMRSGGPINEDITGEENYAVLYAIQESPLEQGVIWTGSNDGLVQLTVDGGEHWKNVTPAMPEDGRVSNIDASPHNAAKAYVAIYRDYLGDDRPYMYKTSDYGQTWTLLSGKSAGIPEDHPVRVVREDPNREGLLYAGTEFGLFISFDDGASWQTFQRNLPVTPVTDLQVIRKDLVLSTHGRSFWIMDDISPLYELKAGACTEEALFTPKDVLDNTQMVYFSLPNARGEDLFTLTWSRDGTPIHTVSDTVKNLSADGWGLHGLTWDLRHHLSDGVADFRGPRVAPGAYEVELLIGETRITKGFSLLMNPNLEITGTSMADLEEQEKLALDAARLLLEIRAEIRKIGLALEETGNVKKKVKLNQRLARLEKGPGPYDQPALKEQVEYLYRMASRTPQKLGLDASARLAALKGEWASFR